MSDSSDIADRPSGLEVETKRRGLEAVVRQMATAIGTASALDSPSGGRVL